MGKFFSKPGSKSHRKSHRYASAAGAGEPSITHYPLVHIGAVSSVVPAGHGLCLSGGQDQTVGRFNFEAGDLELRWTGHEKEVTKVLYLDKSDCYVSASRDKTVRIWQPTFSTPFTCINAHDLVVTGLAANTDNSQICTGSRDNYLKIWDVNTSALVIENSVSRNLVTHVKWSKDTDILVSTAEDKEVRIWDSRTLQVVHSFPKKMHIQTCCDISSDGTYCLTSSNGFSGNGCEATLWDLRKRSLVCEYKGHTETTGACIFLPDVTSGGRSVIATCSSDCTVRLWDQESTACLSLLTLPGSGPLTAIAAYEDGSLCVSSFNTGIHLLKISCNSSGELSLTEKAQF